jgi:hypothetical protein
MAYPQNDAISHFDNTSHKASVTHSVPIGLEKIPRGPIRNKSKLCDISKVWKPAHQTTVVIQPMSHRVATEPFSASGDQCLLLAGDLNRSLQHFIFEGKDGV